MLMGSPGAARISSGSVSPTAKKKFLGSKAEVNSPCWDAGWPAWERDRQSKAKVPDNPGDDGSLVAAAGKKSRRSCSAYQEATAAWGNLP